MRYDSTVTSQVFNKSGQMVVEQTDTRPNSYQFVRGPLRNPFQQAPSFVVRPVLDAERSTQWRLSSVGQLRRGHVEELSG